MSNSSSASEILAAVFDFVRRREDFADQELFEYCRHRLGEIPSAEILEGLRQVGYQKLIPLDDGGWRGFYPETARQTGSPTGRLVGFQKMHREGIWHAISQLALFGPDKRAIVQRSYKGVVDWSGVGHVEAGRTPVQAALDEANEELGLPEFGITLAEQRLRAIPSPDGTPFFLRFETKRAAGEPRRTVWGPNGTYNVITDFWNDNREHCFFFAAALTADEYRKILEHYARGSRTEEVTHVWSASLAELCTAVDQNPSEGIIPTSGIHHYLGHPELREYILATLDAVC